MTTTMTSAATTVASNQSNHPQHAQQIPNAGPPTENDDFVVACRCESPRAVVTLLQCLKDVAGGGEKEQSSSRSTQPRRRQRSMIQPVTVYATPQGMTFHVYGSSKQSQASIDMPASLFSEYKCNEGEFCVNLTTLLECFTVLMSADHSTHHNHNNHHPHHNNHPRHHNNHHHHHCKNSTLFLTYHLSTELLRVELDHQGFLCTAAIPGMVPPEEEGGMTSAFSTSPVVARILLSSQLIRDVLPELEWVAGTTTATVRISQQSGLELATIGHSSQCLIQIQDTTGRGIISNECDHQVQHAFPFTTLLQAFAGLELAHETCVSINQQGIMAIQHQVFVDDSETPTFCDFLLTSLQEDDEDEDENGNGNATPSQAQSWHHQQQQQQQQQDWPSTAVTKTQESHVDHVSSSQSSLLPTQESRNYSPKARTARHSSPTRTSHAIQDDADSGNNKDSDDEESIIHQTSAVSAPLFGTVGAVRNTPSQRRRRRTRQRRSIPSSAAESPNGSVDLLQSDNDNQNDDDSDQTDDRPSPSSPIQQRSNQKDDDERSCSSPELVYGKH
jgi:hypothetical protein